MIRFCGNKSLNRLAFTVVTAMLFLPLAGCFTGIEGTKKITLSKEDRKLTEPTVEDKYFDDLKPDTIFNWRIGKPFVVADARAAVVLVPSDGSTPTERIAGDTVCFAGIENIPGLDSRNETILKFYRGNDRYTYNLRKAGIDAKASRSLTSDRLPLLIDLDLVNATAAKMSGKKYFILSPNWTDTEGNRLSGRKYIEVVIEAVRPGNMVYPMDVSFHSAENPSEHGAYQMNYSTLGSDSRSFASLFALKDPHHKYPHIAGAAWNDIVNSRVSRGMTKEECRLALGSPGDVDSGRDYSRTLDIWQYPDGTTLFFEDGLLSRTRIANEVGDKD